jgi:hypothetical protein
METNIRQIVDEKKVRKKVGKKLKEKAKNHAVGEKKTNREEWKWTKLLKSQ